MNALNKRNHNGQNHVHHHGVTNAETLLRVRGMNVWFDQEHVLKDIDFEVKRGEFLAVLGPNGSGKSTLLNALMGAIPYSGEVYWTVENPKIGYLPEGLSPQKFRELPLSIHEFFREQKVTDAQALEACDLVGLKEKDVLSRNPGELSGGQFQRMLIAWSIVNEPDVILFDEPTSGVDIGGEETIYTLLHKLWEDRKITIILVTHELNVVYAYATNVLCLRKKKLFQGKPKSVLTPGNLRKMYGPDIKFHPPHE